MSYMDKNAHIIYLKPQIFSILTKLLKRREILVVLNELRVLFYPYFLSHTFKAGIWLNIYIYIYIYIYIKVNY